MEDGADGSTMKGTAALLQTVLKSVDDELHLLTVELLPPARNSASPMATAYDTNGSPSKGSPPDTTEVDPAADGAASARETAASRRYELLHTTMAACVALGQDLHHTIAQQPPMRGSSSGCRSTCLKLTALNLEALRAEMLTLQSLRQKLR